MPLHAHTPRRGGARLSVHSEPVSLWVSLSPAFQLAQHHLESNDGLYLEIPLCREEAPEQGLSSLTLRRRHLLQREPRTAAGRVAPGGALAALELEPSGAALFLRQRSQEGVGGLRHVGDQECASLVRCARGRGCEE